MVNAIVSVAKKEIMDNIRNKWVIIISIIFAALTLLVSYAGSLFSDGWQDLGFTMAGMITLVQYIIPIIALMLGYSAIIGEIEKGSMNSLLSLPATRIEILLGKLLGLSAVLSFSILIGFGLSGIIIGLNVTDPNYVEYLFFIGASILMGLIFLSIGLLLSTLFKKRSTAMGGAIFTWVFFGILWGFIAAGVLIASGGLTDMTTFSLPDWFYGIDLINPLSAYSAFVSINIESIAGASEGLGAALGYPSFYTNGLLLAVLFAWFIIPTFLASIKFTYTDI